MNRVSIIIAVLFFSILTGGIMLQAGIFKQHFELSRFINPRICSGCHNEIYQQWKGSTHALAHVDEIYNIARIHDRKGLTDRDEIAEAESCVKCHTPVGFVSGFPKKASDDLSKTPKIARYGVQCDYCHSATGAYKDYNGHLKLDPGRGRKDPGTKRGPFKDASSQWHKSEYSAFHTSSRLCGTCHNVKHVVFGTLLEDTFGEWQRSPYNSSDPAKRVTCQGCHMYQKPGVPATGSTERPENPGKAAYNGKERPHIFTHYFVGGNAWLGKVHNAPDQVTMAEERLKHAATVSIVDVDRATSELRVKVRNTGAGHAIPTGVANIRQVWLKVVVRDRRNRVVYSSGVLDKEGLIPEKTITYGVTFGDGTGKPVNNIAQAREILKDYRLLPLEDHIEKITLPARLPRTMKISVELNYRSIDPRHMDRGEKKDYPELPVIVMASDSKILK